MIDMTMGATRALLLATTAILSVNLPSAYAQVVEVSGNDTRSGPFDNGVQYRFWDTSTLSAAAAATISGGEQYFQDNSTLNASAADAIGGGTQTFEATSRLNASAANAISGGVQRFNSANALNATAADAISGGMQIFFSTSTLNASVANAISGGTQMFNSFSTLNASVANTISGGSQSFSEDSSLNASVADAISGGTQSFYGNSTLDARAANAISGGTQSFYGNSTLGAWAANAISGGVQYLFGSSSLRVHADNGLTTTTDIRFDNTHGGTGGALMLLGKSTAIGSISSITVGSGAITNGAAAHSLLTVDMSGFGPTTFSGTIANGGSGRLALIVHGGTLTLTGTASHTGGTTVSGGTLLVGDASGTGILGGSVDVTNGGTLGGSGTLGSGAGSLVTVAAGGTLSPGNSIGTLTVDGDLVFAAGSRFTVEVNPEGTESDLVAVTGNATLNGGSVAHIGANGAYDLRSTYTILSAAGTLSGAFENVSSDFAFLTPNLLYDYGAGTVNLELARNDRDFAAPAMMRNQIATANGIQSIGLTAGHPVYDAIAQLPDDADLIRASFDALSGEFHGSAKTALIEDSRFIRNAANDRLRAAFGGGGASLTPVLAYGPGETPMLVSPDHGGPAVWSQGFGSWGASDSDGNAASLDRNIGGLLIGADGLVGDWRIGLLAGYSQSSFTSHDRLSSGSSNNYHVGLYGGTEWGNLALRAGAAYTGHNLSTNRGVALPSLSDSLSASYSAGTVQAFGELGYGIEIDYNTRFEPFANLAHVSLHSNDFAEQGGGAALSGTSSTNAVTFTMLGLRAEHHLTLGTVDATLRGIVGWRHAFGDTTPQSTHAFSAGDTFTIAGAPIAKDSAIIEAGFDLNLTPNATFGLSYKGQIAGTASDHGFTANLKVRF